jgi:hypothetical protein
LGFGPADDRIASPPPGSHRESLLNDIGSAECQQRCGYHENCSPYATGKRNSEKDGRNRYQQSRNAMASETGDILCHHAPRCLAQRQRTTVPVRSIAAPRSRPSLNLQDATTRS